MIREPGRRPLLPARAPLLAALFALQWLTPLAATELVVPLRFSYPVVDRAAETALGMDEAGRVTLERDACSRVRLSDLKVIPDPPNAWVSVAFDADLATRLFGRCLGLKNAEGRLRVLLAPRVAEDELAVLLGQVSAELRKSDGSRSLLTRPARALAERVVLPRLEDIRIDVSAALSGVDRIIESFAEDGAPLLSDRSHLVAVSAGEELLEAQIALDLAEPTVDESPEPPLSEAELADWNRIEDELDGFLTATVVELATIADDTADNETLDADLLAILLDARLRIAEALASDPVAADDVEVGEADPIRELFIDSWDQMRPLAESLLDSPRSSQLGGLRLTAFMAGADAIRALDALGPQYNIEISRDGLRRLARMLLAGDMPQRFTPLPLGPDPVLRELFGAGEPPPAPTVPSAGHWLDWLMGAAHAELDALYPPDWQMFVPRRGGLDEVLEQVADLLRRKTGDQLDGDHSIPPDALALFEPLVLATAWKESCWRHYITEETPPEVIRSSIGAIGMMQINGRVWRGIYDLDRLEREIDYNVAAGIEILEKYLVRYAIRRGEHLKEGGLENLPKATYAAYNGGPGHLARYRKDSTPTRLRAIDAAFWRHFEQIRSTGWPAVGTCYAGR